MREIKFRGLRTDGKGWLYGDLLQWKSKGVCAITPQDGSEWSNPYDFEVIPETVGQFTEILDKDGKEIFEGDLISFEDDPYKSVKWDTNYSCWIYWHSDQVQYNEDEYFDWLMLRKKDQKHYVNHGNIHEQ